MLKNSRDEGFTFTELLISMAITLVVTGAALTTFQNALMVNDSAAQLADANQNLRAGTNQLIKDVMQAGRIIGPEGITVPTGTGVTAIARPGAPGQSLTFNVTTSSDLTTNIPDITTGYMLGAVVINQATDMITLLTVDAFMPAIETPTDPMGTGAFDPNEGTIDPAGAFVTLPATSLWLLGDLVNDMPPVQVGDLVWFKNSKGNAVQTVTSMDTTHLYFAANDWFHFNQRSAPQGSVMSIKVPTGAVGAWTVPTTLFRVVMVTYYVDNTTTPGVPRLVRKVNNFTPQALAGVVEDLDLTYDLVDLVKNPVNIPSLPYTDVLATPPVTYNSNQIRKVNIHVGVRSEMISRPTDDYVRNHISTSVDVRSLASVDRYIAQ